MADVLFKNNTPQAVTKSTQQQIVDELAIACQKLDDYLNSSPGDLQCFITREKIAESREHDPIFVMAKSLGDPVQIKDNVQKVAMPLLECLRSFIHVYS